MLTEGALRSSRLWHTGVHPHDALELFPSICNLPCVVPSQWRTMAGGGALAARARLQVTVKAGAPLVGQTIREARFRTRFDAAVVHIRREGRRLEGQLGRVELAEGDELLVNAGGTFDSASDDATANFTDVRFVAAPSKQFMMPMVVPKVRAARSCRAVPCRCARGRAAQQRWLERI